MLILFMIGRLTEVVRLKVCLMASTNIRTYQGRSTRLKLDHVKRLKELELKNARLRKVVSTFTRDKLILKEAAPGNY